MSYSPMGVEGPVQNRGGDTHSTKTSATLISDQTPFHGIGGYSDGTPTSLRSIPEESPQINHVQPTTQANWDDDCFDGTQGWDDVHVRPLGFDEPEETTHSTVLWVESKLARKGGARARVSPQSPLCEVSESEELREESPSRDTSTEPRYTSASTSVSGSTSVSPPPVGKRLSYVPRRPPSPTHGRLLPVYTPPSTIPPSSSLTSSTVAQKRSRGRMVPTIPTKDVEGEEEDEGESVGRKLRKTSRRADPLPTGRSHVCLVEGCGKCFRRREHLKRHTASLHSEQRC
jgi:hypothetical protein